MMQKPDLSVIVVGLNASEFVDQCWRTVKSDGGSADFEMELIYVDNGSTDNTLEVLGNTHPDVIVIENDSNLGFCKAANQGARIAKSDMLCFINDDVIIMDGALERLTQYVRDTPKIGVAGARLLNVDKTDQWSGRRFPTILNGLFARRSPIAKFAPNAGPLRRYLYRDEIKAGVPFEADWVSAAGMVTPADVFFDVGCFDESYYYWHEAVFCDRIARAGYKVVLHTDAKIVHYEGFGSGKRDPAKQRWHIRDFHLGAFRCYLEHHQVGEFAPRALMARCLLSLRKLLLLGISHASERLGSR
ncbi:MAG: glycosyltransferase family 2 protein [Paracoccaceae bacterium]